MNVQEIVKAYILLRDRRAARKAAFTADDQMDKAFQDKIEAKLQAFFNETGQTSASVKGVGTAYTKTNTSATVADRVAFFDFVDSLGPDGRAFLENRVSKSAVDAYVAEKGDVPPGIKYTTEISINVNRG